MPGSRRCTLLFAVVCAAAVCGSETPSEFTIDFSKDAGIVAPRMGFLGGLRDTIPDSLVEPLHPSMFRIGHQFRGRIKTGLTGAVERVETLGAKYKLCMSDLIGDSPKDWAKYDADVKKLVEQTGTHAKDIIWEPANEPDAGHKQIQKYYELYAHAFKALREAQPGAALCGPSFAFPSHDKYRAFLDYCREHKLECNYLSWHYTGWDPNYPEQAKWRLGEMRGFIDEYKDQKIREIHCDEWGAGPDKPGRLHPGRAILWFHYLEDVYKVERACRANWGHEDDYLAGIITADAQTLPIYFVYRWYGATKGQSRVPVQGNGKATACLASKHGDSLEILLGNTVKGEHSITLTIENFPAETVKLTAQVISTSALEKPITEADIPAATNLTQERADRALKITLASVAENQAYRLVIEKK